MSTRIGFSLSLVCALAAAGLAGADQIELIDTLPGTFVDIAAIGTNLHLGDDDSAEIFTTIGNGLLPAGRVVISNNGGVGFDPLSSTLAAQNELIPSTAAFGGSQAVLVYWDDIGNDVGATYYYVSDNALIIQWDSRMLGGVPVTFQVQIFDASEATNPYFQLLYQDISGAGGGASATIGYQDGGTGHNDSVWSFDTAGAVADGGVLSVVPEPSALLMLLGIFLLRRH